MGDTTTTVEQFRNSLLNRFARRQLGFPHMTDEDAEWITSSETMLHAYYVRWKAEGGPGAVAAPAAAAPLVSPVPVSTPSSPPAAAPKPAPATKEDHTGRNVLIVVGIVLVLAFLLTPKGGNPELEGCTTVIDARSNYIEC